MTTKQIFRGSHHYASLLAQAACSKVQTGSYRRSYVVRSVTLVALQATMQGQGFTLTENNHDDECVEQIYIKEQPDHCVPSARQQTVFYIKFNDEPDGSAFFSQRELGDSNV